MKCYVPQILWPGLILKRTKADMHLMTDFETLGTEHNTIVVSLGVVAFNKSGIISEKLYTFDLADQVKHGRTFTASTLQWWMIQSDHARAAFKANADQLSIADFLCDFEMFCDEALAKVKETRAELKVWGNGANFDIVILEDLFRSEHPKGAAGYPWKFWNVWCFRTFDQMTNAKKKTERPNGTHHNALDDARYQANCVMNVWKGQKKS